MLLLAGSSRGTYLTPATSSSRGSLSMAAPGVDVRGRGRGPYRLRVREWADPTVVLVNMSLSTTIE